MIRRSIPTSMGARRIMALAVLLAAVHLTGVPSALAAKPAESPAGLVTAKYAVSDRK